MPQYYEIDSITSIKNNQDISINYYGQKLLDFCIAVKLRVLNGRTIGSLQGHTTYIGNKGHSTVDLVLASEICHLQSGLIHYLSVLYLKHLSYNRRILLKISSLTHSLRNQIEPKNVTLEEKQSQYKEKKTLEKDYSERISQETKKVKNSIINTTNKSISDIDDILGKLQNTFISAADIGLIKVI